MGMKRPRMSAKDSAPLYAALMVEEYDRKWVKEPLRFNVEWWHPIIVRDRYLNFLRSQRDTHPAYAMAIRQIEGKP